MTSVAPSSPTHELPRTSSIPMRLADTNSAIRSPVNGSGNGIEMREVGRKTASMSSNPGIVKATNRHGTHSQSLSQNCASVDELRRKLLDTGSFEAVEMLDGLLTLESPFRQVDVARGLKLTRWSAGYWCDKFHGRYCALRRNGDLYEWALAMAREETGT